MSDNGSYYRVSSYGDKLTPGKSLKIEHSVSFVMEKADISELAALPVERLLETRNESARMEAAVYGEILGVMHEWEEHAARTMLIDKAIEHIKVPAVRHSSNQWSVDEHGYSNISNMVYKMSYHVYEETRYDRALGKAVPCAWHATWSVRTNAPESGDDYGRGTKIAGQEKKRFTDKAACEKYLKGRAAAYAHLFTELSPPLPPEYAKQFKVNGLLLPGYTVAEDGTGQEGRATPSERQSDGEKPSVLERIAEAREEQRRSKTEGDNRAAPGKRKSNEHEL